MSRIVIIETDADEAETTRVFRPVAPLARRMEHQALIQQSRADVSMAVRTLPRPAQG